MSDLSAPHFLQRAVGRWEALLVVLVLVAGAWCAALSPSFLHLSNLLSLPLPIIYIGLLGLGLAPLVLAGDIDISVTSMLAVSAVTCARLWQAGLNVWLAALVSVLLATALGFINGILCCVFNVTSLAITLGTMGAYSGIAYAVLPTGAIGLPDSLTNVINANIGQDLPLALLLFAGCIIAIAILIHRTPFGRYLYIIGANTVVARFTALPVARTRILAFTLSGFMAGLASVAYMGFFSEARADVASTDLITVVTVVVLGGIDVYGGSGSILGLILAFILVAEVDNGMDLRNLAPQNQEVVIGCILVAALIFSWVRAKLLPRLPVWRRRAKPPRRAEPDGSKSEQVQVQ